MPVVATALGTAANHLRCSKPILVEIPPTGYDRRSKATAEHCERVLTFSTTAPLRRGVIQVAAVGQFLSSFDALLKLWDRESSWQKILL